MPFLCLCTKLEATRRPASRDGKGPSSLASVAPRPFRSDLLHGFENADFVRRSGARAVGSFPGVLGAPGIAEARAQEAADAASACQAQRVLEIANYRRRLVVPHLGDRADLTRIALTEDAVSPMDTSREVGVISHDFGHGSEQPDTERFAIAGQECDVAPARPQGSDEFGERRAGREVEDRRRLAAVAVAAGDEGAVELASQIHDELVFLPTAKAVEFERVNEMAGGAQQVEDERLVGVRSDMRLVPERVIEDDEGVRSGR